MNGLKKYQRAVLKNIRPAIAALVEENRKTRALEQVVNNYLFGLPGPTQLNRQQSNREIYIRTVFDGFLEIVTSLEALEDIRFYIRRFPYSTTRIPKERYLRFFIEAYLNELYLLRERLNRYLIWLVHQFRGDIRRPEISAAAKSLRTGVDTALKGFLLARHGHMHEERFRDEGISRLRTMTLLIETQDRQFARAMRTLHRSTHAEVKKKWVAIITGNNRAVRKLLDRSFEMLLPLVFDEKTRMLKIPNKLTL